MNSIKNTVSDPSPILAFVDAATRVGWVYEPTYLGEGQSREENPRALSFGGSIYPTIKTPCGVVKIALDSIPYYYHDGRDWRGCFTQIRHDMVVLAAIVVDGSRRRNGIATEAMKQFISVADEAGFDIELEACPMPAFKAKGHRTIGFRKLRDWYKSLGFVAKFPSEGESILVRNKEERK